MVMLDLCETLGVPEPSPEIMAEGAVLLRGAALPFEVSLLSALTEITEQAPFRHMVTPGGFVMSVAMTNCGTAGWVTDRTGYRYDRNDPESGRSWPPMPDCFRELAITAAARTGHPEFRPDACLINRYEPGTRLSLHRDKNERGLANPIALAILCHRVVRSNGGLAGYRWGLERKRILIQKEAMA